MQDLAFNYIVFIFNGNEFGSTAPSISGPTSEGSIPLSNMRLQERKYLCRETCWKSLAT
jgi:hypothetical protein